MQGAKSRPRPPSPRPTSSRSRKPATVPVPLAANGPPKALTSLRTPLTGIARTHFHIPDAHHDHHALPLSNDLEKTVVPPQSSSGLAALATEVLEEIVFYLDIRRDLRALGATCRCLRDVVHPRHTEYRLIRCRPRSVNVWHHLAGHSGLARNVRHLHILDDSNKLPEIIPSHTYTRGNRIQIRGLDKHTRRQDLILCAIARMTALAKFSWDCNNNSFLCFDDISPTLLMCPSLREVEVADNLIFSPLLAEETSQSDNSELTDLTCVTIRSARHTFQAAKLPSLDRIQQLLISHCPNLTTLRIVYDIRWPFAPRAHILLLRGRWPSLRILSLQNLCCPSKGFDAAALFLAAHPFIETLEFEMGWVQLDLPAGTLPRLRYLTCNRDVAAAILTCPMTEGQIRPLEALKGLRIGGRHDGALIEGLRLCPGLKCVELQSYRDIRDIKHLAEAAPSVVWLNVGEMSTKSAKSGATAVSSVIDWAPVLSALPRLTAFHGVRFFHNSDTDDAPQSDCSQIKKNDEVASMLARICPELKQVDFWGKSGRVVFLGKEGEMFNWEVQRADAHLAHLELVIHDASPTVT